MNMKVKRILIFNVNWLGDVLFSTAAIRNIRYNFPDSFIACAIPSRCYQLLKGNPNLDDIIIFDEHDRHRTLWAKLGFIWTLRNKKFDTVFLLHRSFSRTLICYLAGIPERIGYITAKRRFLLTRKIIPPDPKALHRLDYYLTLIDKAGLKIEDRFPEFFIEEEDRKFVDTFLEKNSVKKEDYLVVLNPGGNWHLKRWPKENWAGLADRLMNEFKAKVVISAGPKDMALAQDIEGLMRSPAISAAGTFNLKQVGALSIRADLFITADTGPLHIANASGAKKIIALFGPTHPKITGPYPDDNVVILQKDVGCQIPCYEVNCQDNRCMNMITVDDVMEKVIINSQE